jgi:hypothetical protein
MGKITRFQDIPQLTRDGAYEVDYWPERLIHQVDEWVKTEGLNLNPDFQRGHIWTRSQKIAYIEFILRGGKTARVIYLNNPSWYRTVANGGYDEFALVDGKQRLMAWRQFLDNVFPVFGSFYRDFSDSLRVTHTMRVNVNDLLTRAEVLQWYLDFNAGGTPHARSEIDRVRHLLLEEHRKGQ